jgi:hypothetical protein
MSDDIIGIVGWLVSCGLFQSSLCWGLGTLLSGPYLADPVLGGPDNT